MLLNSSTLRKCCHFYVTLISLSSIIFSKSYYKNIMSFLYQTLWVLVTQLLKLYDFFFKLPLCVGCLYRSKKEIELTQMVL